MRRYVCQLNIGSIIEVNDKCYVVLETKSDGVHCEILFQAVGFPGNLTFSVKFKNIESVNVVELCSIYPVFEDASEGPLFENE
jgi:hypothetical protein